MRMTLGGPFFVFFAKGGPTTKSYCLRLIVSRLIALPSR
jgi:hypothetical protein